MFQYYYKKCPTCQHFTLRNTIQSYDSDLEIRFQNDDVMSDDLNYTDSSRPISPPSMTTVNESPKKTVRKLVKFKFE